MSKYKEKMIEFVRAEKGGAAFQKLYQEYRPYDEKTEEIGRKLETREANAPLSVIDKMKSDKPLDKRLEESNRILSDLTILGNELVSNIKAANEKREVLRRNYEAFKRNELLEHLQEESEQAMQKLDTITKNWPELQNRKEPMGLYDALEDQKARITDLMKQKDEIIKECQEELKRVDMKYYEDFERQMTDLYCVVERTDNQMEIMKNAYKDHIELLQNTIEDERLNLSLASSRKWEELYEMRATDEDKKMLLEKEKAKFYSEEIDRIALEHEELTRATRIRLERDAEKLQLELRNVKNNVLLNSEKLDYNFQILIKRDDENLIIRNQQKRRVTQLKALITNLRKKIQNIRKSSATEIAKLSKEILSLRSKISQIEQKSNEFYTINDKKYLTVWNINYKEILEISSNIFEIDRLLHEHKLGLEWSRPLIPKIPLEALPSFQTAIRDKTLSKRHKMFHKPQVSHLSGSMTEKSSASTARRTTTTTERSRFTQSSKLSRVTVLSTRDDKRNLYAGLLRNVFRKLADRAGFLVEEKLNILLEPYRDEDQNLVKIDNIFLALGIKSPQDIQTLLQYFIPYSWCPSCMDGIPRENVKKLYKHDTDLDLSGKQAITTSSVKSTNTTTAPLQTTIMSAVQDEPLADANARTSDSLEIDVSYEIDRMVEGWDSIASSSGLIIESKVPTGSKRLLSSKHLSEKVMCAQHYLVIEPALILTALRQYTEDHACENPFNFGVRARDKSVASSSLAVTIKSEDVTKFWSQFVGVLPPEKQKLWNYLEHGLKHYLKILKEREALDVECESLRRQNAELRHLLQKYLEK